jgi:hypothetical protein
VWFNSNFKGIRFFSRDDPALFVKTNNFFTTSSEIVEEEDNDEAFMILPKDVVDTFLLKIPFKNC